MHKVNSVSAKPPIVDLLGGMLVATLRESEHPEFLERLRSLRAYCDASLQKTVHDVSTNGLSNTLHTIRNIERMMSYVDDILSLFPSAETTG